MSDPVTPSEKVQAWIEQGRELLAELTTPPASTEVPDSEIWLDELQALREDHRVLEEKILAVWKRAVDEGWPGYFLNTLLPLAAIVQGVKLTQDDWARTPDSNHARLLNSSEQMWEEWARFHLYKRWQMNPKDNETVSFQRVEDILTTFATVLRVRQLAPEKRRAFLDWPLQIVESHRECFITNSYTNWQRNVDAWQLVMDPAVAEMLEATCKLLDNLYANYDQFFKE
jgi:hypothetical protein